MWRLVGDRHRHAQKLVAAGNEYGDAIAGLVVVETARELVGAHAPLIDGENLVVRREVVGVGGTLSPGPGDNEPAAVVASRDAERRTSAASRGPESKAKRVQ